MPSVECEPPMSLRLRPLEMADEAQFLAAWAEMENFGFYYEEGMPFDEY